MYIFAHLADSFDIFVYLDKYFIMVICLWQALHLCGIMYRFKL